MVNEKKVTSLQGQDINIEAHTVCIHGDGETALDFATQISQTLANAGIIVTKVSDFLHKL